MQLSCNVVCDILIDWSNILYAMHLQLFQSARNIYATIVRIVHKRMKEVRDANLLK